jgi:hypothetical protein
MEYYILPLEKRFNLYPKLGFLSSTVANVLTDGLRAGGGGRQIFVLGNPYTEYMGFHHEALYYALHKLPLDVPDLSSVLPEVRRLLLAGKSKEANALSINEAKRQGYQKSGEKDIMKDGCWTAYRRHKAFEMYLETARHEKTFDYIRRLDLETGEASVFWSNKSGIYERHSLTATDVDLNLYAHKFTVAQGIPINYNMKIQFQNSGSYHVWERQSMPLGISEYREMKGDVLITAIKYDPDFMNNQGYAIFHRVISDGKVNMTDSGFEICDGRNIAVFQHIILYKNFDMEVIRADASVFSKQALSYEELKLKNYKMLSEKMQRSSFSVTEDKYKYLTTEELLALQYTDTGAVPALVEKLYDVGKYFTITETGKYPPAQGQYNININLQICGAIACGLFDTISVFFNLIESLFDDFKRNARHLFGCRGIFANIHPNMKTGLQVHFSYPWPHHYWISCAGWIYHEFWDYYLATADKNFLKEHLVPGLKEIALFYEDFLCDYDQYGNFIFYPSFSPENTPGGGEWTAVTINSVMDIMVCKEVLENLIYACEILGIEEEGQRKWKTMIKKLPAYPIEPDGALKEWAWPGISENYNHRHISHHYALWPAHDVSWEETPDLAKAIQISNRKRGWQNDSAHGILHRLFCAIRLNDLDGVTDFLRPLLERGFIRSNLMTNHFPYHLYFPDMIGSFPAILTEMALRSKPGIVELLPTMHNCILKGKAKGIRSYCFVILSELEWDFSQKYIKAVIIPIIDQQITLLCGRKWDRLVIDGKDISAKYTDRQRQQAVISLQKDKALEIEMFL